MKQTIWKFPLKLNEFVDGICCIEMPERAQILAANKQNGIWCIWALVDPNTSTETRSFIINGTGWEFEATGLKHLKTILEGGFVWHLFECLKDS